MKISELKTARELAREESWRVRARVALARPFVWLHIAWLRLRSAKEPE
jgi:hypothetical protein